jgi:beta-lactam-binding protein with PASTA domain
MKLRVLALAAAVCGVAVLLTACGGGDTTTVIREAAPTTVEKTVIEHAPPPKTEPTTTERQSSPAPESEPEPDTKSPPNVVGLPLPAAERLLKEAGFKPAVKNTDTTFGIIVRSNYTICTEGKPRGNLVPVLAQKYGC